MMTIEVLREVVYGPAGTGKSTYITEKIIYFKKKYKLKNNDIVLSSFTKTASNLLKSKANIKSSNSGTLHSICFKLLKLNSEQVIDTSNLNIFGKKYGFTYSSNATENTASIGQFYLNLYHLKVNSMSDTSIYYQSEKLGSYTQFCRFCKNYDEYKTKNNYVDYSDMIKNCLTEKPINCKMLVIDEAQDLTPLQWQLVYHWSLNCNIVIVAGDDDQCVFDWAGAFSQGMANFQKNFNAKLTILNKSYRLPELIKQKSEKLISTVKDRQKKEYVSRNEKGIINYYNNVFSLKIDNDVSTLILYRANYMRLEIEKMLINKGIPYQTDKKNGLCESSEFKCVALFQKGKHDVNYEFTKTQINIFKKFILNKYKPKIGTIDFIDIFKFEWFDVFNFSLEKKLYFKKLYKLNNNFDFTFNIVCNTIHSSKGKEADRVILLNSLSEKSNFNFLTKNKDSEKRVFYVAMTRAKNQLDIVNSSNYIPMISR